uniref:(northern house mosquito) hypothetical protein n=1 Tax=Culex pipiens TaxID=7175 RepID=A0A8D8MZL2_CULPI
MLVHVGQVRVFNAHHRHHKDRHHQAELAVLLELALQFLVRKLPAGITAELFQVFRQGVVVELEDFFVVLAPEFAVGAAEDEVEQVQGWGNVTGDLPVEDGDF